ncbi:MAG TPA: hypothetical protein O0X42_05085 [Methanocorpusculum sp.]|nr:hypothetical protein [Methanocorpusculum sp.]
MTKYLIAALFLLLTAAVFITPAAAAQISIDQSSSTGVPQGGIVKITGNAQGIATLNVYIYQKNYSTVIDVKTIIVPVEEDDTFSALIESAELPIGEYYVTISPEEFEETRYSIDLSRKTKFVVRDPIPGMTPSSTPETTPEVTPESTPEDTPVPQTLVPFFGLAAGLGAAVFLISRKQ